MAEGARGAPAHRRYHRLAAHHLHGILITEVVAAFDRVVGVPLPMILLHVAQGRANPALRRARMRTRRVELAQYRRVRDPRELQRRPQSGAASTYDHRIELMRHLSPPPPGNRHCATPSR